MRKKNKREPNNDEKPSEQNPPPPDEGKGAQNESGSIAGKKKGKKVEQHFFIHGAGEGLWTKIMSICTVVLACAAIFSMIYTHYDLVDQNEQTKRSVDIAERNFTIENRAWVGLETYPNPVPYMKDQSTSRYIGGTFEIANYGKTPAESLCVGYTMSYGIPFDPAALKFSFEPTRMLVPSGNYRVTFEKPIGNENLSGKLNNGQVPLYFYGIVIYKDIYQHVDTTEFTFKYIGLGGQKPPIPVGINRMR